MLKFVLNISSNRDMPAVKARTKGGFASIIGYYTALWEFFMSGRTICLVFHR